MSEKLNQELNKMTSVSFYQKVARVQSKLSAPKNRTNNFGGYTYRNIENIYEAVKPLLLEEGLILFLTDEIIGQNDRVYVKSTATLTDGYGQIQSVGYAREVGMKKGMDEAQITGSCSSYARKYALGGLFLIDDNKDIDSMDHTPKQENKPAGKKEPEKDELADKAVVNKMIAEFAKIGIEEPDLLGYFSIQRDQIKVADIPVLRDYFAEKKAEYQAQKTA